MIESHIMANIVNSAEANCGPLSVTNTIVHENMDFNALITLRDVTLFMFSTSMKLL